MADVFELLATDHAEMKQMMAALQDSPGRSQGAAQTVLRARDQIAERLVMEASRHETAEEQHFWPAVRQHVRDGDRLADHALSQENNAKEMLGRLDKLDQSDAEFDQIIAQFIPVAQEHIEYEETMVWPELRGVLTAAQATQLGDQVRQAKEHGPTRPHPHLPSEGTAQKVVGPVAAMIDQLRDAVSGRGSDSASGGAGDVGGRGGTPRT